MSLETLENIIIAGHKLTPMMEQYYSIKKEYPDTVLLFRMGDFYELFFEDAVTASKILNITLTHRGKLGDIKIPMAGIPHHAATTYINRFTDSGIKAAICEQIEDPKEAKGIVKRAVTQIASPALPFKIDPNQNDQQKNHYIVSGSHFNGLFYLTIIDFTTGEFKGFKFSLKKDFLNKLNILSPAEYLSYMGQWDEFPEITQFMENKTLLVTYLSQEYFSEKITEIYIEKLIPFYKKDRIILHNKEILSSMGALSYYISSTQQLDNFFHISPFQLVNDSSTMKISSYTLKGLEILPQDGKSYKSSLLGFFDKTKTAMGKRKLKTFFTSPLMDPKVIKSRQCIIQYLLNNNDLLETARENLNEIRDIDRIMAKLSTKKLIPGDLISLKKAILSFNELRGHLKALPEKILEQLNDNDLKNLNDLSLKIDSTINEEIGASLDKGNLIKAGKHKKRDRLANLKNNCSENLKKLETKYKNETKIPKLRIKSNNIFGYFIEVSKSFIPKVPASYTCKQTLTNCGRFTTEELSKFELEVNLAEENLTKIEREIWNELTNDIIKYSSNILQLSNIISDLDVFCNFAWISYNENYSRPKICKSKKIINIKQGWHPLIKANLSDNFICHDLILDNKTFFGLITGPNMAGKTTVMREVAIIQLLTQIGSFVPAKSVTVGIVDYIFSRLGASDDISQGQSTFMVEMSETAEIIRHSTEKSLIILDEVGRGTSTFDGLSIAWSLIEHFIKQTMALTLFATHYHELIELANKMEESKNLTVETTGSGDNIQFLYRLIEEGANQSFGIYVAKLAGLPQTVLNRSKELLQTLEENNKNKQSNIIEQRAINNLQTTQLELFTPEVLKEIENKIPKHIDQLCQELSNLDILNMTPLQAHNKLDDLKNRFTGITN